MLRFCILLYGHVERDRLQAATLILLPIAAAAFGMTAFGIAFLIVEHGGA
jgi:hypothetical protein